MKNCGTIILMSFILLLSSINTIIGQTERNTEIGKFKEASCPFPLPEGLVLGENFRFGYINVPEFHEKPNGKTLQLAVAIFPSSNKEHASDPLVMNTAGPGKSNMDNYVPQISGMLGAYILPDRDIVIIELRGLRYSKPFLRCDEVFEAKKSMMDKNLTTDETLVKLQEAMNASKERFEKDGVNFSAFNNIEIAADIAMIMENLGYSKFNIAGSSAGTMVAHHVIRDYPEMVRCAIMDAGFPIDSTIYKDYVPAIIQTLQGYFKECNNDPHCKSTYPNLERRFLGLLDSLNLNPVIIPTIDPVTGEEINYVLNGYRLSSYIFLNMFYSTQIPYIIGKVLDGDYSDLKNHISSMLVPDYFADGLGYTVDISEAENFTASDIEIEPNYLVFSDGVTRSGLGGEYFLKVQEVWNIPKIDSKKIQYQKQYDVPVLVLNGLYDPVTPPKYDAVMKKHLNNCYIFRFDGVPHSAFDNATECVLPMVLEFLKDPTKAPNSDCVKNYKQVYKVFSPE